MFLYSRRTIHHILVSGDGILIYDPCPEAKILCAPTPRGRHTYIFPYRARFCVIEGKIDPHTRIGGQCTEFFFTNGVRRRSGNDSAAGQHFIFLLYAVVYARTFFRLPEIFRYTMTMGGTCELGEPRVVQCLPSYPEARTKAGKGQASRDRDRERCTRDRRGR